MSLNPTQIYQLASNHYVKNPGPINHIAPLHPEYQMPSSILKAIQKHAREMAALACSALDLGTKITELSQHLTDGSVPKHLAFKFKKFFIQEHEADVRATVIKATIEAEIAELQAKRRKLSQIRFTHYPSKGSTRTYLKGMQFAYEFGATKRNSRLRNQFFQSSIPIETSNR